MSVPKTILFRDAFIDGGWAGDVSKGSISNLRRMDDQRCRAGFIGGKLGHRRVTIHDNNRLATADSLQMLTESGLEEGHSNT